MDSATTAIELAHGLAFRSGLGSSLFASPHHSVTESDVKSFAASAFTKGNIAVLGTGISQSALTQLVDASLAKVASSPGAAAASSSASSYFGGETRVQAHGLQTVFVAFGVSGAPPAELAALHAHLSTAPSVKWSQGLSPLTTSIPHGTSVTPVYLPYSDATLFGLLVQGQNANDVKEAGKAAVQALKNAGSGMKAEELKTAVAKAKFAAAIAVDTRDGFVSVLGAKVCTYFSFALIMLTRRSTGSIRIRGVAPVCARLLGQGECDWVLKGPLLVLCLVQCGM